MEIPGRPVYILFVDDEESILNALKRELRGWLKQVQLQPVFMNDPREALTFVQEHGSDVAIILSDLNMPGLKGTELLAQVKNLFPDIISIILTGFTDFKEMLSGIKSGVFSYIVKPWEPDYLQAELDKALDIHNVKQKNREYTARIKEELAWAGEMQRILLTWKPVSDPRLHIDHAVRPLEEMQCGGDYLDVIQLDGDHYLILIGDVAGHGIKAALVTAILKSAVNHEFVPAHHGVFEPIKLLAWLNNRLCGEFERIPGMHVSFAAIMINAETGLFLCANGGHPSPILVSSRGIRQCTAHGPSLGVMENAQFPQIRGTLNPAERMILYTDGLVEYTGNDQSNSQVSAEDYFAGHGNTGAKELINAEAAARGDQGFTDDVTVMMINRIAR